MLQTPNAPQGKDGFALIVVLVTLGILTFLFAISSDRAISKSKTQQVDLKILTQHQMDKDILTLAADWKRQPENADVTEFNVSSNGRDFQIELRSISSFIDLNTADMRLINLFITFIGGDKKEKAAYLAWRRTGVRMHRVSEFIDIIGLDAAHDLKLEKYATVFSGRRGISEEMAESNFAAHIRKALSPTEIESLNETNSGTTFSVTMRESKEYTSYLGIIRASKTSAEILAQFN